MNSSNPIAINPTMNLTDAGKSSFASMISQFPVNIYIVWWLIINVVMT